MDLYEQSMNHISDLKKKIKRQDCKLFKVTHWGGCIPTNT